MNSSANIIYIRKYEDIDFDLNKLQQLFKAYHPSEIKLSNNDKEESDEKIIGSLIFTKIEDAEMTFALFHHDQLELEYNSLSMMRYTKDLYTCYIKHIPDSFDKMAADLFKLFRKYGPIHKCQLLTHDTVIVQYYSFKNCDRAANELDDTSFPGFPDIKMSVSTAMTLKARTKKKRPSNLKLKNPTKSMSEPSTVNHTSSAATPASFRSYHYSPSTRPLSNLKYPVFEIKPTMDLCNLYIKGLDTSITSIDLFNIFKPFGRIISAKVMEATSNNSEGVMKNFGFVSFSHPIEAAKAMIELYNDQQHHIIVKFHEPKQHQRRSEQDFYQQLLLLRHSTLSRHFYTTSYYKNEILPIPPIPPLPQQPQQPVYAYYVPVITQPIITQTNNNGTLVYQNHSTPTSHYYYYQPQIISDHPFNRDRRPSSKNI